MLEVGQLAAADLLQHCLSWALVHLCICWDGGFACIVDAGGVHVAQVVLSRDLVQEALLVPLRAYDENSSHVIGCLFCCFAVRANMHKCKNKLLQTPGLLRCVITCSVS